MKYGQRIGRFVENIQNTQIIHEYPGEKINRDTSRKMIMLLVFLVLFLCKFHNGGVKKKKQK